MNRTAPTIGNRDVLIRKAAEMDAPRNAPPHKPPRSNLLRVVKSVSRIQLLKPNQRKHR